MDLDRPLYFSTISIPTVGYGDMAPQKAEGRVVVAAEIAFGLFLLVVVIQTCDEHREQTCLRPSPNTMDCPLPAGKARRSASLCTARSFVYRIGEQNGNEHSGQAIYENGVFAPPNRSTWRSAKR